MDAKSIINISNEIDAKIDERAKRISNAESQFKEITEALVLLEQELADYENGIKEFDINKVRELQKSIEESKQLSEISNKAIENSKRVDVDTVNNFIDKVNEIHIEKLSDALKLVNAKYQEINDILDRFEIEYKGYASIYAKIQFLCLPFDDIGYLSIGAIQYQRFKNSELADVPKAISESNSYLKHLIKN